MTEERNYTEPTKEVFDGVFRDVIGKVAQEGGVGRATGQPGTVDVGLTGGTWSRRQNGAIDGRRAIHVILSVPRRCNCKIGVTWTTSTMSLLTFSSLKFWLHGVRKLPDVEFTTKCSFFDRTPL